LDDKNVRRRSPPPSVSCAKMNSAYPEDLSPNDHPILRDHTRQRSASASAVFDMPFIANSVCAKTMINSDKQRRPKGMHQPLSRYHTTPITFEEISEIDEELYMTQQQSTKDEEAEKRDLAILRRASSFNSYSSKNSPRGNKPSFDFRAGTKTRSNSAGAVLFSSSSPPNTGTSFCLNRNKQRSQESLIQLGVSTLPTIPEEWRQQQQQQQSSMEQQTFMDVTMLQKSLSVDGGME